MTNTKYFLLDQMAELIEKRNELELQLALINQEYSATLSALRAYVENEK